MIKPTFKAEFRQIRLHLEQPRGRSVVSLPAEMPYVNNARFSVLSKSRQLTTMLIQKVKNGGFKP